MATKLAPKVVPRTRPLPLRKQLLFRQHEHLLTANPLVLFLRPSDFSAHEWRALRANLAQLPPSPVPSSSSSSSSSPSPSPPAPLSLTVLRPGLLPALLRSPSSPVALALDPTHLASPSHLQGPLAVLTAPVVDPPTLSRVLALVHTFSRTPKPDSAPPAPGAPPVERLALLSALVDRQAATVERTHAVANMPTLEVLRAQLVGLVQAPGSRIVGVVGARAGELARTLEGFKLGLEGGAAGEREGAQAQA
ncbi:hypothetical protein JCM8208_003331 [Rhodotorula glutinis]